MKYFVLSDIHSFYDEMILALDKVGFDKENPDHMLVVLGDVFDRGPKTLEVYNYLKSLNQDRLVLVKGNHESLYLDLLHKWFPESYDYSNGTVKTFCHIANMPEYKLKWSHNNDATEMWAVVKAKLKNHEITQWLKSDKWLDYFEFGKFIGVHSFIPTKLKDEYNKFSQYAYMIENPACYEYIPNWRTGCTKQEWEDARWGNPWKQYLKGLFKPEEEAGKTLICGHWHAYDFRIHLGGEHYETEADINFDPYVSDGIIAIDACTAFSKQVNVLVIEDNKVLN